MYDFKGHLREENEKAVQLREEEFKLLQDLGKLPEGINTFEDYSKQPDSIKSQLGSMIAEEEKRNAEEKDRKSEENRENTAKEIADKLDANGFRSLDNKDLLTIASIVDSAFSSSEDLLAEELALVETALKDSATYRFLRFKKSQAGSLQTESHSLSMEEHKHSLRKTTAYSELRLLLTICTWFNAIVLALVGLNLIMEGDSLEGWLYLIIGPVAAVLVHALSSVYFDIADAGVNTSLRTQNLEGKQSSK